MPDVDSLLDDARVALLSAPRERLGAWRTPRKFLGLGADPKIVPVAQAWNLGRLLLLDDAVAGVGEILRARDLGRRGYTAESARARAALAAAALRGGFHPGEVVHVDWEIVDVPAVVRGDEGGPLRVVDGVPMIRWSAAGALMPLEAYLRERVELLLHPATGA